MQENICRRTAVVNKRLKKIKKRSIFGAKLKKKVNTSHTILKCLGKYSELPYKIQDIKLQKTYEEFKKTKKYYHDNKKHVKNDNQNSTNH